MPKPLSAAELDDLVAELSHPSLPATPGRGSNVACVSKEENDRLVRQAMVLGMGQFAKMTASETRMLAARLSRR